MNNTDLHSIESELMFINIKGAETVQYGLEIIFKVQESHKCFSDTNIEKKKQKHIFVIYTNICSNLPVCTKCFA